jgi:hypothetical protein
MFPNHYSPSNPYIEYSSSGISPSPPLYHQHMFDKSTGYPTFAMQGLNMNLNVMMNPIYITPPQSSSPVSQKTFYSSDENRTNTLEGIYSLSLFLRC